MKIVSITLNLLGMLAITGLCEKVGYSPVAGLGVAFAISIIFYVADKFWVWGQ